MDLVFCAKYLLNDWQILKPVSMVFAGVCYFFLLFAGVCWCFLVFVGVCRYLLLFAGSCIIVNRFKITVNILIIY